MNPNSIKELLHLLVMLACEDDNFHPREEKLIRDVARANSIPEETLNHIIANKAPIGDLSTLSYDDKFEILYNLLVMMKMDNAIMDKEVIFIQKITYNLGFQLSAIMELYPHTHANVRDPQKLKTLRKTLLSHRIEQSTSEG